MGIEVNLKSRMREIRKYGSVRVSGSNAIFLLDRASNGKGKESP